MAAKRKSASSPQRGRARARGVTWYPAFLNVIADSMNVRAACQAANVDSKTAYNRRKVDPEFATAWDAALEDACDKAEGELYLRAVDGRDRTVITKSGDAVTVTEYSDSLLTFLLRAHRKKYRETTRTELTGPDGGPLQVEHDASEALLTRLERLAGGDKPG